MTSIMVLRKVPSFWNYFICVTSESICKHTCMSNCSRRHMNRKTSLKKQILAIILLSCFVSVSAVKRHQEELDVVSESFLPASDIDIGVNFLMKYGYLTRYQGRSDKELTDAVKTFQKVLGLRETGILDENSLRLMKSPRCGLADVLAATSRYYSTVSTPSHETGRNSPRRTIKRLKHRSVDPNERSHQNKRMRRTKRYAYAGRWPTSHITYGFNSYAEDMSILEQQNAIKRALNVWSNGTPLVFTQRWHDEDITISFERGYHDDGYPFDGPGNTLAHAFYPGQGKKSGDVHFDRDETWRPDSDEDGTSLYMVAVHEFGHALGLSHSFTPGSVMLPFYQGHKDKVVLSVEDKIAVHRLYGEEIGKFEIVSHDSPLVFGGPTRSIAHEKSTSNAIPEDASSNMDVCNMKFDAVANLRGENFFFKGKYLWRFLPDGRLLKQIHINRVFLKFPATKVDAVMYSQNNKIIIFSGNKYFSYSYNNKMDPNSPRPITDFGLPSNISGIDAAFVWTRGNGDTYFYKGSKYWRFNEKRPSMHQGSYPKSIKKLGLPSNVDGVFISSKDEEVYFLKGKYAWRMNENLAAGQPERIGVKWFGCAPSSTTPFTTKTFKSTKSHRPRKTTEKEEKDQVNTTKHNTKSNKAFLNSSKEERFTQSSPGRASSNGLNFKMLFVCIFFALFQ